MSYDKTPWVNGTTPAINATNLNKIETGIDEAHDTADEALVMATGRCATFVVAANDSSVLAKQQADYVCDGTDDQVTIQEAIDALPSTGGQVRLLEGTFVISGDIVPKNYTTLIGFGRSTKLILSANTVVFTLTGKNHVVLKDMYLDGDDKTYNSPSAQIYSISGSSHLTIDNVFIENFGQAGGKSIQIESATHVIIRNCKMINNYYSVIRVCKSDYVLIANNTFEKGSGTIGHIGVCCARYCRVVGNIMIDLCYSTADRGAIWIGEYYRSSYNILISNNFIYGASSHLATSEGISLIGDYGNSLNIHNIEISNNIIDTPSRSGIGNLGMGSNSGTISNLNIHDNIISDAPGYGLNFITPGSGAIESMVVRNNIIDNPTSGGISIASTGIDCVEYDTCTDLIMDVLAVSATHIRSNEDLSAATPITFTIDAQPDVPRTLSWAFDTHAQITEYDMEVIGTDAKGNTVTETWDEGDGWSGETSNAFAMITSIKMTSRTGTGAADTMDIGITDVLGLSNIIYATSDVFKIKKNNANATVAGAQVNTTYDTYDMSVITLGDADDFTIWYKSNLNTIS